MASLGHIAVGMAAARVYHDGRLPRWRSAVFWSAFVVVKFSCHECLTLPMAAVCEHSFRGGTTDVQIESNRVGGYIKERQFAGCTFYWHENNT